MTVSSQVEETDGALYLKADKLVVEWMQEYKRHLLDGDPNVVHPKAKAALVLAIARELRDDSQVEPSPRPSRKTKPAAVNAE